MNKPVPELADDGTPVTTVHAFLVANRELKYECPFCTTDTDYDGEPLGRVVPEIHTHGSWNTRNCIVLRIPHCCSGNKSKHKNVDGHPQVRIVVDDRTEKDDSEEPWYPMG